MRVRKKEGRRGENPGAKHLQHEQPAVLFLRRTGNGSLPVVCVASRAVCLLSPERQHHNRGPSYLETSLVRMSPTPDKHRHLNLPTPTP